MGVDKAETKVVDEAEMIDEAHVLYGCRVQARYFGNR